MSALALTCPDTRIQDAIRDALSRASASKNKPSQHVYISEYGYPVVRDQVNLPLKHVGETYIDGEGFLQFVYNPEFLNGT